MFVSNRRHDAVRALERQAAIRSALRGAERAHRDMRRALGLANPGAFEDFVHGAVDTDLL